MYNSNVVQPLYSNKIFSAALRMYELFKLSVNPAIDKTGNSKEYLPYIVSALSKGYTVVDVGRHKKSYSLDLTKICKLPGRLVTLEGNHEVYNYLQKLKHLMNFDNIIIEELDNKVDVKSQSSVQKKAVSASGATIIDFRSTLEKNTDDINSKATIDRYCSNNFIIPSLIKFKLDENDLSILYGAKNVLQKYKPQVLIECFEGKTSRHTLTATFKFLAGLHYNGYFILDTIKIPLANFDFNTYQNEVLGFYCNNFVFE